MQVYNDIVEYTYIHSCMYINQKNVAYLCASDVYSTPNFYNRPKCTLRKTPLTLEITTEGSIILLHRPHIQGVMQQSFI